jgi:glycosyltransferase involved in cell wall biosynthesis
MYYFALCFFCLTSLFASESHPKKTICLNMIVKNESSVITRCLQSALPFIDTWVIVDTGSTDGTQQIIKNFLKDVPGELHERPWVNFGANRQEALTLAKNKADYILFMDADDVLVAPEGFQMPELTRDFYALLSRVFLTPEVKDETWFHRIVKSDLPWLWKGVIHEDLLCDAPAEGERIEGLVYLYLHDGERGKNPLTLQKDIELLHQATREEPEDPRNYFYLGRTYLQMGDQPMAIKYLEMRGKMKGNLEELFYSKLMLAKLYFSRQAEPKLIQKHLFDAYQTRPYRAEPLYYLSRSLREEKKFQEAYDIIQCALQLPAQPNDLYYLEQWVYDFGLLYELAATAAATNRTKEAIKACQKILARPDLPDSSRKETEQLLESIYQDNLAKLQNKVTAILNL